MAHVFPFQAIPHTVAFRKSSASRSGGATISGLQRVVRSDAGFWLASVEVAVFGEHRTLAWRSFYAAMDGMAGEVLVPCYTNYRPVDGNGRRLAVTGATTIGSSGVFGDNTGLGQTETPIMWAKEAAVAGSTRLVIRHPKVPPLRPGHYFGIGDRLYLIAHAWNTSLARPELVGGAYTFGGEAYTFGDDPYTFGELETVFVGENVEVLEFWPRLREAVPAGTPLILGRPVCKMRLAKDDTGAIAESMEEPFVATIDLVEVV